MEVGRKWSFNFITTVCFCFSLYHFPKCTAPCFLVLRYMLGVGKESCNVLCYDSDNQKKKKKKKLAASLYGGTTKPEKEKEKKKERKKERKRTKKKEKERA